MLYGVVLTTYISYRRSSRWTADSRVLRCLMTSATLLNTFEAGITIYNTVVRSLPSRQGPRYRCDRLKLSTSSCMTDMRATVLQSRRIGRSVPAALGHRWTLGAILARAPLVLR